MPELAWPFMLVLLVPFLARNQSTVAQLAEMTVAECSLTSGV